MHKDLNSIMINTLKEKFASPSKFFEFYLKEFLLKLRKGAYPYEYMNIGKNEIDLVCRTKKVFIEI